MITHEWDESDPEDELKAAFEEYRVACYGKCGLSEIQLKEVRQAFFSGIHWLNSRHDSYDPDELQQAESTMPPGMNKPGDIGDQIEQVREQVMDLRSQTLDIVSELETLRYNLGTIVLAIRAAQNAPSSPQELADSFAKPAGTLGGEVTPAASGKGPDAMQADSAGPPETTGPRPDYSPF